MEKLLVCIVNSVSDFGSLQKTDQQIVYSPSIAPYIVLYPHVLSEWAKHW